LKVISFKTESCSLTTWKKLDSSSSSSAGYYAFSGEFGSFWQAKKFCAGVEAKEVEINSESEYALIVRELGECREITQYNVKVIFKPRQLPHHQHAQVDNITPNSRQPSFI
jgi:hypothetical protein